AAHNAARSPVKESFLQRARPATLPHPIDTGAMGGRPQSLTPLLDSQFDTFPALLRPVEGRQRPADATQEWNDGSELQYLGKYQPFPDGISPFALAYNCYKRAEVLMNVGKQRHAQLSETVIDSRPALSLKSWVEEEWEQGRRRELQAFGVPVPEDRTELEMKGIDFKPDREIVNRQFA